MQIRSLRSRMTAAFALAFAALILFFGGFVLWYARYDAHQDANDALQSAVNKIRGDSRDVERRADSPGWIDEWDEFTGQNLALAIVDAQGRLTPKTPGRVPTWPHPDTNEWRIRTVALGPNTAVIGYYWQDIENGLRLQALTLSALSLSLFLAATFGAWILVGRTLSPIYGLSLQADAASLDSLHIHLNAPSQDTEIVHLVGTLNDLLARLAGAISARERFYAAASHELRTPLQTLTGFLELALMRPRDAAGYRLALEDAYAQSERLSSLVQALLLLNQLEATPARQKEPIDMSAVCAHWMTELSPLASSRHLFIRPSLPKTAVILSIPTHLDILIRNLLENALKYATPNSQVEIRLTVAEEGTRLTLFNSCPPSPSWDESLLFEPFYRPDASRNSATGGNGLGLAICKAVTVANGWRLSLRQQSGGVQTTVEL